MVNSECDKTVYLLMACDENFYKAFLPCLYSIQKHTKSTIFLFFIGTLTNEVREIINKKFSKIHLIEVDLINNFDNYYNIIKKITTSTLFTEPCLYRIIAPFILKELDKILYLDCDTILNGDIAELFEQNFSESVAVVKDVGSKAQNRRIGNIVVHDYFYSGMILFNAKRIRSLYSIETLVNIIDEIGTNLDYPDQDILNYWFLDDKKILPLKYNNASYRGYSLDKIKNDSLVYHYCGEIKPWTNKWICLFPLKLYLKNAYWYLGLINSIKIYVVSILRNIKTIYVIKKKKL